MPRPRKEGAAPTGEIRISSAEPPRSTFDEHHPPDDDLIADCVHCGFCLPTCPTYALWGEEMDSPRGRIYLMKMGNAGEVPMDDTFVGHFDACLGCMACVTACPSGVQYEKLIEATRPQLERHHRRTRADRLFRRLVFGLFPHPRRLRAASLGGTLYQRMRIRALLTRLGLLRRLPARLRALEELMPPMRLRDAVARAPRHTPARGTRRLRVGVLLGCVQRVFFHDVNAATIRVLAAEGHEVFAPRQGCCGALEEHSGHEPAALARARRLIDTFEPLDLDAIVVNVAGCGSVMKQYGHLLRDDPAYAEKARAFAAKVRDVTELLADEPVAPRQPIPARLAYHHACHLVHAQQVREQPLRMLRTIPGLDVVEIPEADMCCGSAGVYNLLEPEPAEDLGRRKVDHVAGTSPDAVAAGNPGCLLQIRRYLDPGIPSFHPVELLDASIRGVNPLRRG
jgi:glycolate oxidase iron-sulfur subunit